jgi:hypothetical protein
MSREERAHPAAVSGGQQSQTPAKASEWVDALTKTEGLAAEGAEPQL